MTAKFTQEKILDLIQSTVTGLYHSSMIESDVSINSDTKLFGNESSFDSMAFVGLMTDIEDKLATLSNKDIFVVLSDLEDLFPDAPALTAGMLSSYLTTLVND